MPIIGNGMIAKNLEKTLPVSFQDIIFFASGVSNSSSADQQDFERELSLLAKYSERDAHLVYFSTCSIYDSALSRSPYVKHKLKIEQILGQRAKTTVIRLPQVIGNPPNPFTLCHFLYNNIVNRQSFRVWSKATRYLIDIDDALAIMYEILPSLANKSAFINIAPPKPFSVLSLVHLLEQLTGLEALYKTIEKGGSYSIDITSLTSSLPSSMDRFGSDYLKSVLSKYFANPI